MLGGQETGFLCVEEPEELACKQELNAAKLRIEPSIERNRIEGDDVDFVPTVGEDRIRFAVKALLALDARVTDGEGDGGKHGGEECASPWIYSSRVRLRVRDWEGVAGISKTCKGVTFPPSVRPE